MRGYWGRPEETARTLRDGDTPGEKLLYSGDLFRTDEEGFLHFVGRRDDVFKCKGEKISPREVEEVLYALADVAEAAVVPVESDLDGVAVAAYVVLRDGSQLTVRDIRRHCREKLESYKVPSLIETRNALPHNEAGKLDRRALSRRPPARVEGADDVRDSRNAR
jgi:acyl-coenzyme A synthetase/AMP-(fatty) acid ligase